jgi:hypothetical protein
MQTEVTNIEPNNFNNNQIKTTTEHKNVDNYPKTNSLYMRPHDHQVPAAIAIQQDDLMAMSNRLVRKTKFLYKN